MSVNRYEPHIIILPEDDANRQIANGFSKCLNVKNTVIQVLPPAKGWGAALEKFETDLRYKMDKYANQRVLMLVDYDNQYENRFHLMQEKIPDNLRNRVFILGVKTEPEDLRRDLRMTFEEIGTILTENCPLAINEIWKNSFLIHNESERMRMVDDVRSFLFI